MTVYVDHVRHYPNARWTRKHWCHMVTDGPMEELHAMARVLGLPPHRLHGHRALPHYDLTPDARDAAIALGAEPIGRRELVGLIRKGRDAGRDLPGPAALRALQLDGVDAVIRIARSITDWSAPTPCTEWDARTLAAHLRATAARYLALVDAVRVTPVAVHEDLAARNAAAIAALPRVSGPEHLRRFEADARLVAAETLRRGGRAVHVWPDGRVMHGRDLAGIAAVEWHVHAWDLAQATGHGHIPKDPATLAAAWRASVVHIELPGGDAWDSVLTASGRVPSTA